MTSADLTRRNFNRAALVSLLTATAATAVGTVACRGPEPVSGSSSRREVTRQKLPGEPARDLVLVEVTYPPGKGSPAHLHANGVMAFVVAGSVTSKVDDGPEQTFHAGDAWWEPPGAKHWISRNASPTDSAKLLAIYVAPNNATPLDLMQPLA